LQTPPQSFGGTISHYQRLLLGEGKARLLDLYRQNILREIIEPGFVNPFAVLSWAVELPTNLTHTGFDRPITHQVLAARGVRAEFLIRAEEGSSCGAPNFESE
jgi:hypothetical protein